MQTVKPYWYRLYYGWMLLYSIGLLAGFFAVKYFPSLESLGQHFELTTTTALLSGLYLFYALTVFWFIRKRNEQLALFAGLWIFAMILLNGLGQTNPHFSNLLYALPWIAMAAFNGMFGAPIALGSVCLTGVYIVLEHEFDFMSLSGVSVFLFVADAIAAYGCYRLWRRVYINVNEARIQQLTGMIVNKDVQSQILIESINEGVIGFDHEGVVRIINPAAAKLTGWDTKDAQNLDVNAVMMLAQEDSTPLEREENPISLAITSKQHVNKTLQLTSKTGNKTIISLSVSPVIVPDIDQPVGGVAVFRDISADREEEQRRAEFISTASHEMRTPVAAIEGYLALAMNDRVSRIDSKARSYLEKAHSSTQHLGKLFQDLLTSARAEDGRLASHPVVVEMGEFLERLAEDLRFAAQKKGLQMEFVMSSGAADQVSIDATASNNKIVRPLYYVHVDPDRIREVVTNLFDNAVKYTESGKVSLGLTGDQAVVQVYVRDTGAGIPAEDIPHLFQKFYRVDSSATRTVGGTGLGLFICRKIVELYQGRIWVESEPGKGSTFYINLPRLGTARAEELRAKEASHHLSSVPGHGTIRTT